MNHPSFRKSGLELPWNRLRRKTPSLPDKAKPPTTESTRLPEVAADPFGEDAGSPVGLGLQAEERREAEREARLGLPSAPDAPFPEPHLLRLHRPEIVGHFRSPKVGHFRSPLTAYRALDDAHDQARHRNRLVREGIWPMCTRTKTDKEVSFYLCDECAEKRAQRRKGAA